MQLVNVLGDSRGPLLDAAGDFWVQRVAVERVPQYGLCVGLLLGVAAGRFRFGAHAGIVNQ